MKTFIYVILFLISLKAFSCPGVGNWSSGRTMGPGNMGNMMNNHMGTGSMMHGWMGCQMAMIRHHYYMQFGLPSEYSDLKNPLTATDKTIEAGKKIYEKNCMSCHGQNGYGNGEAGQNLNPKPADLASFAKMPMASDSYLFWTISDGGEKLNTAMPSFKKILSKDDIWSAILYIRKL